MKISAENINKFDFLIGHGNVEDVKFFYAQKANTGRTSGNEKMILTGADYAKLVTSQQEESYQDVVDRVVITINGKQKTFFCRDEVEIYRISKVA